MSRSSTNDRKNPYQVHSKINKFWNDDPIPGSLIGPYSEEQKEYFEARYREYLKYKWPPPPKKKKAPKDY